MKGTTALVFALVCIVALSEVVSAGPSDMGTKAKDVKDGKEIKDAATASKDVKDAAKNAKDAEKKKKCAKVCPAVYDPVCAHDPAMTSIKPTTFNTPCALEVYNCEKGTKLTVKSKGECPGAGRV